MTIDKKKYLFNFATQRTFIRAKMHDPIETLSEIRSLMDRSSRFISLSGLSGVFAGIFAILGAAIVWIYGKFYNISQFNPLAYEVNQEGRSFPWFTVSVAVLILIGAITTAVYFTSRNTKKKHIPLWDNTSKRLLINLAIPLIAGGIFSLILISKGYFEQVIPVTLLFYGMALLNGSKYTLNEIRYLAMIQIVLGLISSFFTGWGLLFWVIGFGFCHIFYGIKMYYKYEK